MCLHIYSFGEDGTQPPRGGFMNPHKYHFKTRLEDCHPLCITLKQHYS